MDKDTAFRLWNQKSFKLVNEVYDARQTQIMAYAKLCPRDPREGIHFYLDVPGEEEWDVHVWWPDFFMPEDQMNLFFAVLESSIIEYLDTGGNVGLREIFAVNTLHLIIHNTAQAIRDFEEINPMARQWRHN